MSGSINFYKNFDADSSSNQERFQAELTRMLHGYTVTCISSDQNKFRLKITDSSGATVTRRELLQRLAAKLQKLKAISLHTDSDHVLQQPHVEVLSQIHDLKNLLNYITESSSEKLKGVKKAGVIALRAFGWIFKAPFAVIKAGVKQGKAVDRKIVETWRKRSSQYGPEVMKKAKLLHQAIASKNPDMTLQSVYEEHVEGSSVKSQVDEILKEKNSALKAVFRAIANLFRSTKKGGKSNKVLKQLLIQNRIHDAHFLIRKGIFSNVSLSVLHCVQDLDFSAEEKRALLRSLFHASPDIRSADRIIDVLRASGQEEDLAFAKSLVEELISSSQGEQTESLLLRAGMFAAKLGDEQLLQAAFNIDSTSQPLSEENRQLFLSLKDERGRTLLHYAAQGNNGFFVHLVAKTMREKGINNPFLVKDRYGDMPIYMMSRFLAHQLDELYGIDGNHKGSFSRAVDYCQKIKAYALAVGRASKMQGLWSAALGPLKTLVLKPIPESFAKKTVASRLNVDPIADAIAAKDFSFVEKAVTKFLRRWWRQDLSLQQYENRENKIAPGGINQLNALKRRKKQELLPLAQRFAIALKRRDVRALVDVVRWLPKDFTISNKMVDRLNQIFFYPTIETTERRTIKKEDSKNLILKEVVARIKDPKVLENLMDGQLHIGNHQWVKERVERLKDAQQRKMLSDTERQVLVLMSVKLGRVDILQDFLSSAEQGQEAIPWFEWQNKNGDTLLHLAAASEDVKTVLFVAENMANALQKSLGGKIDYRVKQSQQSLFSLSGLLARISGKRTVRDNVFNIQNGQGEKISDIISANFAHQLDRALGLNPSAIYSFSFMVGLREERIALNTIIGEEFNESVNLAMSFALSQSSALLVKGAALVATAKAGPFVGALVGFIVRLTVSLGVAAIASTVLRVLLQKKTGDMLADLEMLSRGYDNEIQQLGMDSKEVHQRLATASQQLTSNLENHYKEIHDRFCDLVKKMQIPSEVSQESREKMEAFIGLMTETFVTTGDMDEAINAMARALARLDLSVKDKQRLVEAVQQAFRFEHLLA